MERNFPVISIFRKRGCTQNVLIPKLFPVFRTGNLGIFGRMESALVYSTLNFDDFFSRYESKTDR